MNSEKELLQADVVCPSCQFFGQAEVCRNCIRHINPQIQSNFVPPSGSDEQLGQDEKHISKWRLPYCTLCSICCNEKRKYSYGGVDNACRTCLHGHSEYVRDAPTDLFVPNEPLSPDVNLDLYTGLNSSLFDCGTHVLADADKWPDRYYRYFAGTSPENYVIRPRKLSEQAFEDALKTTCRSKRDAGIFLARHKEGKTYKQIGDEFHLTGESIRRIVRNCQMIHTGFHNRRYLLACAVYGSEAFDYLSLSDILLKYFDDFSNKTLLKFQKHQISSLHIGEKHIISTLDDLNDYAESYLRERVGLDDSEIEAVKNVIVRFGLELKDEDSSRRYFEIERVYKIINEFNGRRMARRMNSRWYMLPYDVSLDYVEGCYLEGVSGWRRKTKAPDEKIEHPEYLFRKYIEDVIFFLLEDLNDPEGKTALNAAGQKAWLNDFLKPYFRKKLPEYAPIIDQVLADERTNIVLCARILLRYSKNNTIQKRLKGIIGTQYTEKDQKGYDKALYSVSKHICEDWNNILENAPTSNTPMEELLKEYDYKISKVLQHYGYSLKKDDKA